MTSKRSRDDEKNLYKLGTCLISIDILERNLLMRSAHIRVRAKKYPAERSTQIGEGHNWARPFRTHVPCKPEDDAEVELTGVHIWDPI